MKEETKSKHPIKVMSKQEIRAIYNISRETFNNRIKAIQDKIPHYQTNAKVLLPAQVEVIFKEWGLPE